MKNIKDFYDNNNKMMIVDGDLIIYKIASSLEEPIDWGNDIWTLHSDLNVGKQLFKQNIEHYKNYTKSADVIIAFSDKENFRKQFDSSYKSYRKKIRKPICYQPLRKWVEKNYTENLILRLSKLGVKGVTYDQDVMNSFIDGCYLELPKKLNFTNESLPLKS